MLKSAEKNGNYVFQQQNFSKSQQKLRAALFLALFLKSERRSRSRSQSNFPSGAPLPAPRNRAALRAALSKSAALQYPGVEEEDLIACSLSGISRQAMQAQGQSMQVKEGRDQRSITFVPKYNTRHVYSPLIDTLPRKQVSLKILR